jgi:hypothetical protein
MTTDKIFSEEIIKHYLEDELYEKRGIARDEYGIHYMTQINSFIMLHR